VIEFLVDGFGFIASFLGYFVPFLLVLAPIVFIHEMGHFLVGRWCGVKVETFSLGFGPRLFGFMDRKGTQWVLSAIPLGGFVKFKGDSDAASSPDHEAMAAMTAADRAESFPHKSIAQRSAIVAAGPIANFLLAFVIFTSIFAIYGQTEIKPVVHRVVADSAAEQAGFQPGDSIDAINNQPIESFSQITRHVSVNEGEPLHFSITRNGQNLELVGTPRIVIEKTILGTNRHAIMGFSSSPLPEHQFVKQFTVLAASKEAVGEIAMVIERTGAYIGGLVKGQEKADQLSGPLRIAYISGKVAESGIKPLLILAAILSVSIGLLNLLPVPMLDGGHLVFYAYEGLLRRPMNELVQSWSLRIGFGMLVGLMLFSTWNDLVHLTGFVL